MRVVFSNTGWEDLTGWFNNPKILKKIDSLFKDIVKNGAGFGIGKPEKLKYYDEETYSRRIDEPNRLVYQYDEENELLSVVTCKGHYE
jgi:toxin YoeB